MVKQKTEGKLLGNIAKYTIITLAFFMALNQLGVASTIVNAAFILILGGFTLAFGLAFGLGGREAAGRTLDKLGNKVEQTTIQSPGISEWKNPQQSNITTSDTNLFQGRNMKDLNNPMNTRNNPRRNK